MKTIFPKIPDETRLTMLRLPDGPVDAVLDTDTYNEIDDQFAVAYTLLSPERIRLKAIYAAPFSNENSTGPKDGMEKSYEELQRLLALMDIPEEGLLYKGSACFLPDYFDYDIPVESDAARDLVKQAMAHDSAHPLYVMAIGAVTNVVSAMLTAPEIIDRIVVIWLGGHAHYWDNAQEFNLMQDLAASQVLFDSGVPLIQLPCLGVVDHLVMPTAETQAYLAGDGGLGDFLHNRVTACFANPRGRSRVIWDISAPAILAQPEAVKTDLRPTPWISDEGRYSFDSSRPLMRCLTHIDRDAVFGRFFSFFPQKGGSHD